MPTNTPKKGLPKGNGSDNARDYLKGAISGGGLWHALEVLDNDLSESMFDAKGDLLVGIAADTAGRLASGVPGSFLTADPAAATGLAWATTPSFIGQGEFLQDVVVRDTLFFGQQGSAAPPDVSMAWVGPKTVHLRSTGAAWSTGYNVLEAGVVSTYGHPTAVAGGIRINSFYDNTDNRAIITGPAIDISLASGELNVYTAASAAANAVQSPALRLSLQTSGTLTLTPSNGGNLSLLAGNATNTKIQSNVGNIEMHAQDGVIHPMNDGAVAGSVSLGAAAKRWSVVYAVAPAINTCARDTKTPYGDLDPETALHAVLSTPIRQFSYNVTPERIQRGYYADEADPLFLVGPDQVTPSNDAALAIAAIQALAARMGISLEVSL